MTPVSFKYGFILCVVSVSFLACTATISSTDQLPKYRGFAKQIKVKSQGEIFIFKKIKSTATPDGGVVFASNRRNMRWVRVRKDGFVSPEWFGCKGDGKTDVTQKFQYIFRHHKLIDLGPATKSYLLSDSIVVQSGTRVKGQAELRQTAPQKAIFAIYRQRNIRFDGLRLTGKGDDSYGKPSFWARGISIVHSKDIHVANCTLTNFSSGGVYAFKSSRLLVQSNQIKFTNPNWSNPSVCGIALDQADSVYIKSNTIEGTGQGICLGANSSHAVIIDNDISNISHEHGMYLDAGLQHVYVLSNRVRKTGPHGIGIKIQTNDTWTKRHAHSNVIANNLITETGTSGIAVVNTSPQGKNLQFNTTISNNRISKTKEDGINCSFTVGTIIENNHLTEIGRDGISVRNSDSTNIFHNVISDCGHNGILVNTKEKNVRIEANQIKNAGLRRDKQHAFGIFISDASEKVAIIDNQISASERTMDHSLFIVPQLDTIQIVGNQLQGARKSAIHFYTKTNPKRAILAGNAIEQCQQEIVNAPDKYQNTSDSFRKRKTSPLPISEKKYEKLGTQFVKE